MEMGDSKIANRLRFAAALAGSITIGISALPRIIPESAVSVVQTVS